MAKPELGTKRLCTNCGAKFYDLGKDPIICPKCDTALEIASTSTRSRMDAVSRAPVKAAEPEVETAEATDAEFVSLEEADKEAEGTKAKKGEEPGEDEDIEIDADDDSTFLEETEDENEDVSDIIGSEIEDEEET